MNIKHCDYISIEVNTIIIDEVEKIAEMDVILNFSEYTKNRCKLVYGINIPSRYIVSIREWNTYACNLETTLREIPDYCLVSGYNSFNDMSVFILSYDAAKPVIELIDGDKFSEHQLLAMKIAITNRESEEIVKKFHHDRLMNMLDDNAYDEES